MNESKTNPYRYYISYLLRELAVGEKFKPSELHITVLPWFALETDEKPFIDWFCEHFSSLKAFDAIVGEQKLFGPRHDVPVNLIGPKDNFLEMHMLALSWFGKLGARWAEKDPYVGGDYLPHVAQRSGYVLNEGERLHIGSLSLFKAARQEDHVRIVAAKAVFREPA